MSQINPQQPSGPIEAGLVKRGAETFSCALTVHKGYRTHYNLRGTSLAYGHAKNVLSV